MVFIFTHCHHQASRHYAQTLDIPEHEGLYSCPTPQQWFVYQQNQQPTRCQKIISLPCPQIIPAVWCHLECPQILVQNRLIHSLSQADLAVITALLNHYRSLYLDELQDELWLKHSVHTTLLTIHCALQQLGISHKVISATAYEQNEMSWLIYMNYIVEEASNVGMLMFVDEAINIHCCADMGIRQGCLLCGSEVVCKRFVVLNHSCRYTWWNYHIWYCEQSCQWWLFLQFHQGICGTYSNFIFYHVVSHGSYLQSFGTDAIHKPMSWSSQCPHYG